MALVVPNSRSIQTLFHRMFRWRHVLWKINVIFQFLLESKSWYGLETVNVPPTRLGRR
jgi:hypothetical protein